MFNRPEPEVLVDAEIVLNEMQPEQLALIEAEMERGYQRMMQEEEEYKAEEMRLAREADRAAVQQADECAAVEAEALRVVHEKAANVGLKPDQMTVVSLFSLLERATETVNQQMSVIRELESKLAKARATRRANAQEIKEMRENDKSQKALIAQLQGQNRTLQTSVQIARLGGGPAAFFFNGGAAQAAPVGQLNPLAPASFGNR